MTSPTQKDYWDKYYAGSASALIPPSQFAAFAIGELHDHDFIVDVGCGNGRDSLFFSGFGKRVLGVDGSHSAIAKCKAAAAASEAETAEFLCLDVASAELEKKVSPLLAASRRPLIYARFFLHAITDEDEAKFLEFAARNMNGGTFALEFRTIRDEALHKVTPDHYRRFVDPVAFTGRARDIGLHTTYFIEGFGMAKYKNDDAYVARILLKKVAV